MTFNCELYEILGEGLPLIEPIIDISVMNEVFYTILLGLNGETSLGNYDKWFYGEL